MIFDALVAGYIRQNALRSGVTVMAIALGVAALLAGDLARTGAAAALQSSVSGLSERANLQVLGFGTRLDERLLARARQIPGVEQARPVLRGAATLGGAPASAHGGDAVTIEGIDTLQTFPGSATLRTYEAGPFAPPSALDTVLVAARGAVISASIAREFGLRAGSRLTVGAAGSAATLQVAAVLLHQPPALDSGTLIVDITTAQALLHATGRLDRIDVVTAPQDAARTQARLAAALGSRVHVVVTTDRIAALEQAARGFDLDLTVLAVVVLLVGVTLVANAVGISVRGRRPEIGTLRAIGATRGQIVRAFVLEGMLLGAGGALIGSVAGDVLAGTTSASWGVDDTLLVLRDMGLGIAFATVAALGPALQAAATLPADALRVRHRLRLITQRLTFGAQRLPPSVRLALTNLDAAAARLSLALFALIIAIAAATSVATATNSFDATVTAWAQRSIVGDLSMRPVTVADARFSARTPAAVARLPGVATVLTSRRITLPFRGTFITLDALDKHTLAARGLALAGREASFSQDAAAHFGVRRGQTVTIDTPAGPTDLQVCSIDEDMETGNGGTLTIAAATYTRLFGDATLDTIGVIARPGSALAPLRLRLAAAASPLAVDVASARERRALVAASFDRTFTLTYALGLVSIAIALFGTIITMVALVLERRREIGMLRMLGLSKRGLRSMIVSEAAVLAALAAAGGAFAGIALGAVLVTLDRRRFGWSVAVHVPIETVLVMAATVVGVAALAALLPARHVARLTPAGALRVH